MKPTTAICLTAALLLLAVAGCKPSGSNASGPDPAGTWEMAASSTNIQPPPPPLMLRIARNGGALTGTLGHYTSAIVNGKATVSELPITEAKLQGNQLSFNFSHPPAVGNGPNADYKYQGAISGDTITGTVTIEWMGETHTRAPAGPAPQTIGRPPLPFFRPLRLHGAEKLHPVGGGPEADGLDGVGQRQVGECAPIDRRGEAGRGLNAVLRAGIAGKRQDEIGAAGQGEGERRRSLVS